MWVTYTLSIAVCISTQGVKMQWRKEYDRSGTDEEVYAAVCGGCDAMRGIR